MTTNCQDFQYRDSSGCALLDQRMFFLELFSNTSSQMCDIVLKNVQYVINMFLKVEIHLVYWIFRYSRWKHEHLFSENQ